MRVLIKIGKQLIVQLPLDMSNESYEEYIRIEQHMLLVSLFGAFYVSNTNVGEWILNSKRTESSKFLIQQMLNGECEYMENGYTISVSQNSSFTSSENNEIIERSRKFNELIC